MTEETTVDETAGTPVPDESAAPSPADEPKEVEPGTTDTPADAAENKEPEKPESEEDKKRNKVSAKERINQLTQEKYQYKRDNDDLKRQIQEINERLEQSQPELKKPRLADFESDEAYEEAVHDYHKNVAKQEQEKTRKQETQKQEAQQKQAEAAQAAQKFVSDLQKDKANYDGIDEVMADPTFALIVNQMPQDVLNLIQTSDKNVALAYHLGTHLDEAEKIATLPPVRAARELALLESRLELPTPKTITNAPDPIKTPSSASTKTGKDFSNPKDRDAMTDEEWMEHRRKTKQVL